MMHDEIILEAKAGIAGAVVGVVDESMTKTFVGLLHSDPSEMDPNIQRASG